MVRFPAAQLIVGQELRFWVRGPVAEGSRQLRAPRQPTARFYVCRTVCFTSAELSALHLPRTKPPRQWYWGARPSNGGRGSAEPAR